MPIKFPKGFARRRSGGNALDSSDPPTPTESSFRVLPRADDPSSHQENNNLGARPNSSPTQRWTNGSYDHGTQLSNRTHHSSSTEGDRLSYQSTEPSSVESRSEDDLIYQGRYQHRKGSYPQAQQREEEERPQQKHRFSIAAGRTFSFPRPKLGKTNTSSSGKDDGAGVKGRDRSMTTSSYSSYASTAMPPHSGLEYSRPASYDEASHGSDWFNNAKSGRTPIMEEPHSILPPLPPPKPAARSESDTPLATEKQFSWEDRDEIQPKPLSNQLQLSPSPDLRPRPRQSWESHGSETGFLPRHTQRISTKPEGLGLQTSSPRTPMQSDSQSYSPQDSPSLDAGVDDALLDSLAASEAFERQYAPQPPQHLPDRSLDMPRPPPNQQHHFARGQSDRSNSMQSSNTTTPKAPHSQPYYNENVPSFERSRDRDRYTVNERASILPRSNKVMSRAEFENLKRTSANRTNDDDSDKSDESEVDYEEDEAERTREIAKQRRKQEAHMTVYRQQMMKVTGEQPNNVPSLTSGRPTVSRSSHSLPSLGSMPHLDEKGLDGETGPKTSDDEDEDVPLGVLQAHGFPSSSRPPTRLTGVSSQTIPRASSQMAAYPVPPGASRNDAAAGGGGNTDLPPFARGLPRDPYVGASLVNQSQRESFQTPQHSGGLPPGGLVGVIAGEERAKALRRGSPNVNGGYGPSGNPYQRQTMPQMPQPGMAPPFMAMPFLPVQQPVNDQAQLDMNASMQQMMQMQMQWMQQMQQMMQMQGMQIPPGMQLPPGMMLPPQDQQQAQPGAQQSNAFLSPMPFEQQNNRESRLSAGSSNDNQQQPQRASSSMSQYPPGQRSPSMLGAYDQPYLSGNGGGLGAGYAPSIAPSERSNVGQPSRYRPVTPASGGTNESRTQTMSYSSAPSSNINNPRSRSPHKLDVPLGQGQGLGAVMNPPSTVRAVNKPKKGTGGGSDDEEDDAAWAEMRKRREQRRSRWTARKKEKEEAEMPKEGLEGLYYEG